MHTVEKGTVNVPAFLTKLWKIVEDPAYDNLVCWSANGKSFIIRNQSRFAKELLPLFFKHNNMASFIRQLNMYGFRKLTSIENSGLRTMDRDDMEFYHQYFVKGQESYLELIKRKVTTGATVTDDPKRTTEDVTGIITEMKDIKGRQQAVDSALSTMQKENEALWREIAILRQKYQKQQQIVEKLIQFLLTLVHTRGLVGVKRKTPLMIDMNNDESHSKMRRLSFNGIDGSSNSGPIIHDITDTTPAENEALDPTSPLANSVAGGDMNPLITDADFNEVMENQPNDVSEIIDPLVILDPLQSVVNDTLIVPDLEVPATSGNNCDSVLIDGCQSPDKVNLTEIPSTSLDTQTLNTPSNSAKDSKQTGEKSSKLDLVPSDVGQRLDNFSDQLDGMETELNWLQEHLSIGNFNIDANSILELFTGDDPTSSHINRPNNNFKDGIGKELVQYNPSSLASDFDVSNMSDSLDSNAFSALNVPSNSEMVKEPELVTSETKSSEMKMNNDSPAPLLPKATQSPIENSLLGIALDKSPSANLSADIGEVDFPTLELDAATNDLMSEATTDAFLDTPDFTMGLEDSVQYVNQPASSRVAANAINSFPANVVKGQAKKKRVASKVNSRKKMSGT